MLEPQSSNLVNSSQQILFLLGSLIPCATEAIVVANYSSATNDRFANDPSFVGAGLDFSGVGRTSNGRWATLIGDNYFLTASHFPASGTVQFLPGNDPSGTVFQYTVAGSFAVPGTDIRIGYFNQSVDPSIARYSYNTNNANAVVDLGLGSATLYTSGDQVPGAAGTIFDHVVATNQAESWFEEGTNTVDAPNPGGNTNTFMNNANFDQIVTFENLPVDDANNFETYESQLQGGDSGSPLFSDQGGTLRVEGIAYAIVTPGLQGDFDTPPGQPALEIRAATLYSYLGSYDSDIQNAIANVPDPIPEPSAVFLGVLATLGGIVRRKR